MRARNRRRHLPAGRRLLREAEERVPLIRASVSVPGDAAEELRARFVELAPGGFEERETAATVELAAYGEAAERVLVEFPAAHVAEVEPGWEDRWRSFHHGVRIGPLWVGPPWEEAPDDALTVVIDPGRAFGTGSHPTTRLCLELLLELQRGSVIDVGCGSGVLAIAAARLGFDPVVAVDMDESAVEAAGLNAAANAVSLDIRRVDGLTDSLPVSDVAVVNIARAAIEAVAGRLEANYVVSSGYLADEMPTLARFRHLDHRELDGWAGDLYIRA